MSQVINTNTASLNAQRNLAASQSVLATSMQRLSSGLRVNTAKDDAAGLAISERMNSEIRGMKVAVRNANDAISLAQTAEGALAKMSDSLQRMRELAVQSANATNDSKDREAMQQEFMELQEELDRIATGTKFNSKELFVGDSTATTAETFDFQVGAFTDEVDTVKIEKSVVKDTTITADSATASGTLAAEAKMAEVFGTVVYKSAIGGEDSDGNTVAAAGAQNAIDDIDKMLNMVNSERAKYGASQNRFEAIVSFLGVRSESQEASRGRITDADYAQETTSLTRAQILQQAGTAMLAQANQLPSGVLSLLR